MQKFCIMVVFVNTTLHTIFTCKNFIFFQQFALVFTKTIVHEDWEHSTHHYSIML